jgi:hypothetical protein
MDVLEGDDARHRLELVDDNNFGAWHRAAHHERYAIDGIAVRDDLASAIGGIRVSGHALHIYLHHVASFGCGIDRNVKPFCEIGSVIGMITVSVAKENGFRM